MERTIQVEPLLILNDMLTFISIITFLAVSWIGTCLLPAESPEVISGIIMGLCAVNILLTALSMKK